MLYYNNHSLEIEKDKIRYNDIRKKYLNLADEARMKFECFYIENYADIDDVVENVQKKAKEIINSYFDETFYSLVVDIDTAQKREKFKNEYNEKKYYIFDDEFAKINAKFIEIEQKKIKKDSEIENRYKLEEEAEEKNLQNTIKKLAKGAINTTMSAIDKTEASFDQLNEKKALFENKKTISILSSGVFESVLNIHLEVVSYLIENKKEKIKVYTQKDIDEAKNLFENAKIRNRKIEDFSLDFLNAIERYPYEDEFYRYMVRNFKDEKNELEKIAEYFNIDIHQYKIDNFLDSLDNLDVSDEENALKSRENIQKNLNLLGLDEEEVKKIPQIAKVYTSVDRFDLNYRTVEDTVFETRDEADLARWESEKIHDILKDINYDDEQSLIEKEKEMQERNFKTKIADKYITDLRARIINKDLKYRTVNGREFETRDEADLAREEKRKIESLIDSYGILTGNDISEIISKINLMDLKCHLEDEYLLKLNSKLEGIKKLNDTASNISKGAKAIGKKISDIFK